MNDLGKSPRSCKVGGIVDTIKQEPCFFDNTNSIESLATMDSEMESPIFFNTPYKIKDPIVVLERCDKIWETMQLIKTMQELPGEQYEESPPASEYQESRTSSGELKNPGTSERYIRYQPVLSNGNTALPNFRFSVKRVKKLYHCNSCGRQFAENRSLRLHSYRVHGIFIPARFRRTAIKKGEEDSKADMDKNERKPGGIDGGNLVEGITKEAKLENMEEDSNASSNSYESPSTKPYFKRNVSSICAVEMRDEETEEEGLKGEGSLITKEKSIDNPYVKCPLCKRSVKCTTTHIVNYHKIKRPELIMKGLGQSFGMGDDKKLVKDEFKEVETNDTNSDVDDADMKVNSRRFRRHGAQKRKLNNSSVTFPIAKRRRNNFQANRQAISRLRRFDYKVQCKVCLGFYSPTAYENHLLEHASEKKVDKSNNLGNSVRTKTFGRGKRLTEELSESSDANPGGRLRRSSRLTRSSRVLEEGTATVCACGRTFRKPHHLFMHRSNCRVKDEIEAQRQNSSDRDSGIGINITIKKKNDSYEIVGKDSGDENRSKDSGHSKDGDLSSDSSDLPFENFKDGTNAKGQVGKYSKNHSVILVKSVNEDVNVDIEDDSQLSSCSRSSDINDNLRNKTNTIQGETVNKNEPVGNTEPLKDNFDNNDKETRRKRTSESAQNEKSIKSNESEKMSRKVPTLKSLCQKALANGALANTSKNYACDTCQKEYVNEHELLKHVARCSRDTNETCVCGKTFTSVRYLNVHGRRAHPLLQSCPYCKETLKDISTYIEHHCDVIGLIQSNSGQDEIRCPYCDKVLSNSNKFDEHIKFKHFDPILAYQCYKCMKRFPNRPQRLLHFRREHNTESYFCKLCRRKINGGLIEKHESYHQGLGYPCHQCKRAYPTKVSLVRHHMESHNDSKKKLVTCNICKKSIRAGAFKKHLNIHTKYDVCALCKKTFNNELKLEAHIMKKHPENYPRVRCNSCGMSFTTKLALQKHIQTEKCYKYSEHIMEEEMLCDI